MKYKHKDIENFLGLVKQRQKLIVAINSYCTDSLMEALSEQGHYEELMNPLFEEDQLKGSIPIKKVDLFHIDTELNRFQGYIFTAFARKLITPKEYACPYPHRYEEKTGVWTIWLNGSE